MRNRTKFGVEGTAVPLPATAHGVHLLRAFVGVTVEHCLPVPMHTIAAHFSLHGGGTAAPQAPLCRQTDALIPLVDAGCLYFTIAAHDADRRAPL